MAFEAFDLTGATDEIDASRLNDTDQARLKDFQDLFAAQGWDYFMRYARSMQQIVESNGARAATWEENRKLLGAAAVWEDIENFETSIMNEFMALATEQETEEDL